jgi:hypothetical protein
MMSNVFDPDLFADPVLGLVLGFATPLLLFTDQSCPISFELCDARVAFTELRLELALRRLGRCSCFLSLSELVLERSTLLLKRDLGETLGVLGSTGGGGRGVG